MKAKYPVISSLLVGMLTYGSAFADEFINVRPFFGNFHGNGPEVAFPLFQETDANNDGHAESVVIRYRVYTAATGAFVSQTTPQRFIAPTVPAGCAANGPNFFESEFEFKANKRRGGLDSTATLRNASTRIHSALVFTIECFDGNTVQERYATAIYSADMSGATPKWVKYYNGLELIGFNGIDTDGDLRSNMQNFVLVKEFPSGAANTIVYSLNSQTGATVLPARSYPIAR